MINSKPKLSFMHLTHQCSSSELYFCVCVYVVYAIGCGSRDRGTGILLKDPLTFPLKPPIEPRSFQFLDTFYLLGHSHPRKLHFNEMISLMSWLILVQERLFQMVKAHTHRSFNQEIEVSSETIFNFWFDRCLLGAKATL